MQSSIPTISFCIIVLNGEPFIKYCLRQIYKFAFEIIVIEGGSEKAKQFAPKGTSTDGTLSSLIEFQKEEDFEKKMKIITKNSFWSEKDEQSNEYTKYAKGDYIWQIDIDEFYKEKDIIKILEILASNPCIDLISFPQITFWGDIKYCSDSIYLRNVFTNINRIFKWRKGFNYLTHRPPTILDEEGTSLKDKNWVVAEDMKKFKIIMYHYSLIFPKQVEEKVSYYSNFKSKESLNPQISKWAQNSYFKLNNIFKVHNVQKGPSWLEYYKDDHPEQILALRKDVDSGYLKVTFRKNEDVELLLKSNFYQFSIFIIKFLDHLKIFYILIFLRKSLKKIFSYFRFSGIK